MGIGAARKAVSAWILSTEFADTWKPDGFEQAIAGLAADWPAGLCVPQNYFATKTLSSRPPANVWEVVGSALSQSRRWIGRHRRCRSWDG